MSLPCVNLLQGDARARRRKSGSCDIYYYSSSKKLTIHDNDSPREFLEILTIHDSIELLKACRSLENTTTSSTVQYV